MEAQVARLVDKLWAKVQELPPERRYSTYKVTRSAIWPNRSPICLISPKKVYLDMHGLAREPLELVFAALISTSNARRHLIATNMGSHSGRNRGHPRLWQDNSLPSHHQVHQLAPRRAISQQLTHRRRRPHVQKPSANLPLLHEKPPSLNPNPSPYSLPPFSIRHHKPVAFFLTS